MRTLADSIRLVRRSDFATAPAGLVTERIDGAFVDSTRDYPSFWHGNRIVLDRPPSAYELERWSERHRELFAWREGTQPVVVTWYDRPDVPASEIANEINTALIAPSAFADAPQPAGLHAVQPSTDAHWEGVSDLISEIHPEYGDFARWRVATLRALVEGGRGIYRALLDANGAVVAALGAFHADGVGRYANVQTAQAYRRRGCAAYQVTSALRDLRTHVDDVVIVAETGGEADRLYRRLGFVPILSIQSILR